MIRGDAERRGRLDSTIPSCCLPASNILALENGARPRSLTALDIWGSLKDHAIRTAQASCAQRAGLHPTVEAGQLTHYHESQSRQFVLVNASSSSAGPISPTTLAADRTPRFLSACWPRSAKCASASGAARVQRFELVQCILCCWREGFGSCGVIGPRRVFGRVPVRIRRHRDPRSHRDLDAPYRDADLRTDSVASI